MLIAGLVPVGFLAFSMQYGMMNQLREKEQYNLEKMLEQSVRSLCIHLLPKQKNSMPQCRKHWRRQSRR